MNHDPASERLRAMASEMEASTTPERADMLAARSLARARAHMPRRRSLVAAVAGAAIAFAGAMGVGAIADQASPGQALYGVDRAYESAARFVGVKTDRSTERLEEALKVIDRGDRVTAAKLVDEALAELQRVRKLNEPVTTTTAPASPVSTSAPQISAAPAAPVDDPSQTLRLAVERLLRTVRGTEENDLEAAASDALAAATAATAPEPGVTVEAPTASTSTTVVTSTTVTTLPSTTTTTADDGNNGKGNDPTTTTSSTTTTTLPPIILPPQP